MPLDWFSIDTTRSRRCLKIATFFGMKSVGPFRAATAAAWLIELAFDVLCDCTVIMALISSCGPAA